MADKRTRFRIKVLILAGISLILFVYAGLHLIHHYYAHYFYTGIENINLPGWVDLSAKEDSEKTVILRFCTNRITTDKRSPHRIRFTKIVINDNEVYSGKSNFYCMPNVHPAVYVYPIRARVNLGKYRICFEDFYFNFKLCQDIEITKEDMDYTDLLPNFGNIVFILIAYEEKGMSKFSGGFP